MNLRLKFGKGNKTSSNEVTGDNNSGWDSIGKEVPFRQAEEQRQREEEQQRANMERQQRKIIAGMMYDVKYMNAPDVILAEGVEDSFLQKLNSGEISADQQRDFLNIIQGPIRLRGAAAVNESLGDDKHFRRILGFALNGSNGFSNYDSTMSEQAVQDFEAKFPTPMDFENMREQLLGDIKRWNTDTKYQEYVQDVDKFQSIIYGKKYEYYKSLQGLKEKAKTKAETEAKSGDTEITEYTQEEKERVLDNSIIDGDDFLYRGQYYHLTPDTLREVGLSPEHKMVIDGVEIGLSGCFSVDGRDAMLGYVKTDDGYKVRGYYRSKSQGVWRYLADYVTDGGKDDGIGWWGKGYTEEMTTLPCKMQKELSQLAMGERVPLEKRTVPSFILAGTAKVWQSEADYLQARTSRSLRGDVYQEVDSRPTVDFGRINTTKIPPENVDIKGSISPDYSKELMNWTSDTRMYGRLTNRVYSSFDGKLKYTVSEDAWGRCFMSNIETDAKLTSAGTRSKWVAGGDVETPLYEYGSQTDGYGDQDDVRGSYENMWENYLSKMPIIQKYLQRNLK